MCYIVEFRCVTNQAKNDESAIHEIDRKKLSRKSYAVKWKTQFKSGVTTLCHCNFIITDKNQSNIDWVAPGDAFSAKQSPIQTTNSIYVSLLWESCCPSTLCWSWVQGPLPYHPSLSRSVSGTTLISWWSERITLLVIFECIVCCLFTKLILFWNKKTFLIESLIFWIYRHLFIRITALRFWEMQSLIYVFLILVQTCLTHHICKID